MIDGELSNYDLIGSMFNDIANIFGVAINTPIKNPSTSYHIMLLLIYILHL